MVRELTWQILGEEELIACGTAESLAVRHPNVRAAIIGYYNDFYIIINCVSYILLLHQPSISLSALHLFPGYISRELGKVMEVKEFNHVLNRRIPYLKSTKSKKESLNLTETEKAKKSDGKKKQITKNVQLHDKNQKQKLDSMEDSENTTKTEKLNDIVESSDDEQEKELNEDEISKEKGELAGNQDEIKLTKIEVCDEPRHEKSQDTDKDHQSEIIIERGVAQNEANVQHLTIEDQRATPGSETHPQGGFLHAGPPQSLPPNYYYPPVNNYDVPHFSGHYNHQYPPNHPHQYYDIHQYPPNYPHQYSSNYNSTNYNYQQNQNFPGYYKPAQQYEAFPPTIYQENSYMQNSNVDPEYTTSSLTDLK